VQQPLENGAANKELQQERKSCVSHKPSSVVSVCESKEKVKDFSLIVRHTQVKNI
jgi:hypothetical protein